MNLKQSLHSLLADNETAEVITQLRALTEESVPNLQEEVEQVAARFEANIDQSHSDFADELSTSKENARIRYLLLSIINRLPDDAELPSAILQKRSKMAVFIVIGVAVLALIAFNLDLFRKEMPPPAVAPVASQVPMVQKPAVVAEQPKPVVSAVPAAIPAAIVMDTTRKDTLPKKKIRRIRKPVVVPAEPVLGVSQ
jgi:Effector-associated domain 11